MARIVGIDLPKQKRIIIAITYIFGIGSSSAKKILKQAKIAESKRAKDLTEQELTTLRTIIEKDYKIEGDLKRIKLADIKRLREIKCWRGVRHMKGLPARGQKTRKNSRTVRGNVRKTVSSGKKAAPAPK